MNVKNFVWNEMNKLLALGCCVLMTSSVYAANITVKIPKGAKPIVSASVEREKQIIKMMPQKDKVALFGGEPKIYPTGIMDNYGENISLYEGQFSNQGKNEYMFLSESRGDTVSLIYREISPGKLMKVDFDKMVIKNLLHNKGDMGHFYSDMTRPIAYVENNKTYLRFMSAPYEKGYLVCTYLWKGDQISLVNADKSQLINSKENCLH